MVGWKTFAASTLPGMPLAVNVFRPHLSAQVDLGPPEDDSQHSRTTREVEFAFSESDTAESQRSLYRRPWTPFGPSDGVAPLGAMIPIRLAGRVACQTDKALPWSERPASSARNPGSNQGSGCSHPRP